MTVFQIKRLWIILALVFFAAAHSTAYGARKPVKVDIGGDKAKATYVQGEVHKTEDDLPAGAPLVLGDQLYKGNRFSTGEDARIELKLPDDSFLRFDEKTAFELTAVEYDPSRKKRSISVRMILGKTWANVSKMVSGEGRFEVTTRTAVAGVRGTVYRVNVQEDDTVIVKVYWGEILLKSKPAEASAPPTPKLSKPSRALGPQPIAGPKPVSMEEWTYIVKSMQQIIVRPDGTATKPFRFSPQDDLNGWVRWNKERDEAIDR